MIHRFFRFFVILSFLFVVIAPNASSVDSELAYYASGEIYTNALTYDASEFLLADEPTEEKKDQPVKISLLALLVEHNLNTLNTYPEFDVPGDLRLRPFDLFPPNPPPII